MEQATTDAEFWRLHALEGSYWGQPPETNPNEYYYMRAEEYYNREKKLADEYQQRNKPFGNAGILVSAVILLTFGRLDVIPDILEISIHPFAKVNWLRRSVWMLVPFPPEVRGNTKAAIAWVENNKNRLHWHEEKGHFVLDRH